jgi:hypothetical protein
MNAYPFGAGDRLGRGGARQAAFGASIVGGVCAPIRFCALIHAHADAAYARALAERIGDAAQIVMMPVASDTAPVALGPGVAAVLIWSQTAAGAGLSSLMATYLVHDRASLILAPDGARLPAGFVGANVLGSGDGDVVVDGGLVRDALTAWKAAAAPVLLNAQKTSMPERGAFMSGIAASVAVFGMVSVGGYVFLPAVAAQDAAPSDPTAAAATATLENAFAAAPAVAVVYAGAENQSESYISARFGADLRIVFSGPAAPSVMAEATPAVTAPASVAPAFGGAGGSASSSTFASSTVAPSLVAVDSMVAPADPVLIVALDQTEPYGPLMLVNSDQDGVTPLFITDSPSEEPLLR